jgi:hypothetical protein
MLPKLRGKRGQVATKISENMWSFVAETKRKCVDNLLPK